MIFQNSCRNNMSQYHQFYTRCCVFTRIKGLRIRVVNPVLEFINPFGFSDLPGKAVSSTFLLGRTENPDGLLASRTGIQNLTECE